jgi:hypothetical protein
MKLRMLSNAARFACFSACFACFSQPAFCQSEAEAVEEDASYAMCEMMAELAGILIDRRYTGLSMADALRMIDAHREQPFYRILRTVLMGAYELPYFTGGELREHQRQSYVSQVEVACFRGVEE